jgi:hypothetical protein
MRPLGAFLIANLAGLGLAQTPPASGQAAPQTPPAAAATAAPDAASPVPSEGLAVSGWVEVGYRWRSDVGGNFEVYRSFVNLGSGPKLTGTEFTITDPKHRLFDDIRVQAYDWGGEPWSSLHVGVRKAKIYDFDANYRDIAYFDNLPSYADPLQSRGITLNEQSFDTRRRLSQFELNILPGNWISPYVAYDHNGSSGTGVSTFVASGNEYPVPALYRDWTSNFRGGLRFQLRRFHATIEQGGTWFEENQTLYQSGGVNPGNVSTPVFGQKLALTSLLSGLAARGTGIYTKGLLTANPVSWLDFYGQFLYSQPNTTVNYQQYDGGNLYLPSQLAFFANEQFLVSSYAQQPHTMGTAGAEIRPMKRLRITESWITDRMHNAGSSKNNQTISGGSVTTQQFATLLQSSLASNYNQIETMAYYEPLKGLTLRGGYRYVWGDSNQVTLPPAGLAYSDHVSFTRNVGIGGVSYRPMKKLLLSAEGEAGSSSGQYFRTSLYDYDKVRAQARYQLLNELSLSATFSFLNNENPLPSINFDYLSHQESVSLLWQPSGGKIFDLEGSYSRSGMHSSLGYLDPGTLQPQLSKYRDNMHSATALIHIHLPIPGYSPQLLAGGSFILSSGSRPTSYYQPMAKLTLPVDKHFAGFVEWQYYGYGEAFYLYEGFRAHLLTIGMRYTR